jgi:hypothetical protein
MRDLIVKDLRLHKKLLLFLSVLFPLYMGIFGSRLDRPGIFALFGALMFAIAPLMLFTREDKFKAMAFGLSLPTTRSRFLASRYVLSWALMAAFYALSAVIIVAVPGSRLGAAGFRPGTILASFVLMALFFGILTPLTVRFGPVGVMVLMVVFQVLGIAAMSVRPLLGNVRAFAVAVKAALSAARGALGPTGSGAALVAAIVLLNLASFALSRLILERRDY